MSGVGVRMGAGNKDRRPNPSPHRPPSHPRLSGVITRDHVCSLARRTHDFQSTSDSQDVASSVLEASAPIAGARELLFLSLGYVYLRRMFGLRFRSRGVRAGYIPPRHSQASFEMIALCGARHQLYWQSKTLPTFLGFAFQTNVKFLYVSKRKLLRNSNHMFLQCIPSVLI